MFFNSDSPNVLQYQRTSMRHVVGYVVYKTSLGITLTLTLLYSCSWSNFN